MAPTKEQYQAALSALRDDARQWSDAAAELSAAGTTADGLTLDARAISSVGDVLGVTQIYTELQQKLARLLGEAQAASADVSTQLLASAHTYQDEEDAGVHRMNNIW